jgi:hypothetical protein
VIRSPENRVLWEPNESEGVAVRTARLRPKPKPKPLKVDTDRADAFTYLSFFLALPSAVPVVPADAASLDCGALSLLLLPSHTIGVPNA